MCYTFYILSMVHVCVCVMRVRWLLLFDSVAYFCFGVSIAQRRCNGTGESNTMWNVKKKMKNGMQWRHRARISHFGVYAMPSMRMRTGKCYILRLCLCEKQIWKWFLSCRRNRGISVLFEFGNSTRTTEQSSDDGFLLNICTAFIRSGFIWNVRGWISDE